MPMTYSTCVGGSREQPLNFPKMKLKFQIPFPLNAAFSACARPKMAYCMIQRRYSSSSRKRKELLEQEIRQAEELIDNKMDGYC